MAAGDTARAGGRRVCERAQRDSNEVGREGPLTVRQENRSSINGTLAKMSAATMPMNCRTSGLDTIKLLRIYKFILTFRQNYLRN